MPQNVQCWWRPPWLKPLEGSCSWTQQYAQGGHGWHWYSMSKVIWKLSLLMCYSLLFSQSLRCHFLALIPSKNRMQRWESWALMVRVTCQGEDKMWTLNLILPTNLSPYSCLFICACRLYYCVWLISRDTLLDVLWLIPRTMILGFVASYIYTTISITLVSVVVSKVLSSLLSCESRTPESLSSSASLWPSKPH